MTSKTRTDIHAPASADFDPSLYTFQDVVDLNPDPEYGMSQIADFNRIVNQLYSEGFQYAAHQQDRGLGQCGHCGAHIRYAALLTQDAVKELIVVGETCLDNRFTGMSAAKFQQLRKLAQLNAEKRANQEKFILLCDENPILAYASSARNIEVDKGYPTWHLDTMLDIAKKAEKWGSVSVKQLSFLDRLMDELEPKKQAAIARVQEQAEAGPVPIGKVTIIGEVLSLKYVENHFAYNAVGTYKMLLKLDNGSKVFVTVPNTIEPEVGNKVQLTATVEASKDDPKFGFGKRPTQASIL